MDTNNRIYGEYGEKFLDDIVGSNPDEQHSENQSNSGGIDILQQSLQEARILDTPATNDLLDFNNLIYSYHNHHLPSNDLEPGEITSKSFCSDVDSKVKSDSIDVSFNVSEFLNITKPTNQTNSSCISDVKTTIPTEVSSKSNLHQLSHSDYNAPKCQSIASPSFSVSQYRNLGPLNTLTQSKVGAETNSTASIVSAKPVTYIQLQLPKSTPVVPVQNSISALNSSSHTAQYIISGVRAVSLNNSSTVQQSIVHNNGVAVCSSTYTKTIDYAVSNPVVLTVDTMSGSVAPKPITLSTSVLQNVDASHKSIQQLQNSAVNEQQVDKLALLLQNKATSQPGSGKILRVGAQTIDVSDSTVAKALATKILQQREKQSRTSLNSGFSSIQNIRNQVTVLDILGSTNSSCSSSVPVSASNVQSAVPQRHVSAVQNAIHGKLNSACSSVVQSLNTSPVIHLSDRKSNSPIPINRVQIARVNISRSANQTSSLMSTRSTNTHPVVQPVATSSNTLVVSTVKTAASPLIVKPGALTTTLKLNLTPQQASNLTSDKLQKIVAQHQAAVSAFKQGMPLNQNQVQVNQQMSHTRNTGTLTTKMDGNSSVVGLQNSQGKMTRVLSFRVDPNLSLQQLDEVQQIILKKLPGNKIPVLTTEQKQLLSVFKAHLRTMEQSVQQYYLKNPRLLLQRIFQQLQTGKPYVFQIKLDQSPAAKNAVSLPNSVMKSNTTVSSHPTITLTDSKIQKSIQVSSTMSTTPSHRKVFKRTINAISDATVYPQPLPAKRPFLIMEQLEKHQELAMAPNITTPFRSVRDAFRRLLPYHVYNTPQIEEKSFIASEKLFSQISENVLARMSKMIRKYHLLCLKDAAMDVCSAEAVLLERIFQQNEKAEFLEVKQTLLDDPDTLLTYLPPTFEDEHPLVATYLEERLSAKLQLAQPESGNELGASSTHSHKPDHLRSEVPPTSTKDSAPTNYERTRNEMLLQEAVESILT